MKTKKPFVLTKAESRLMVHCLNDYYVRSVRYQAWDRENKAQSRRLKKLHELLGRIEKSK